MVHFEQLREVAAAEREKSGGARRRLTVDGEWQQTACILCECNCGIEVQLEGRHLAQDPR